MHATQTRVAIPQDDGPAKVLVISGGGLTVETYAAEAGTFSLADEGTVTVEELDEATEVRVRKALATFDAALVEALGSIAGNVRQYA